LDSVFHLQNDWAVVKLQIPLNIPFLFQVWIRIYWTALWKDRL